MKRRQALRCILASTSTFVFLAATAHAQDGMASKSNALQTDDSTVVVVTAQKREQKLQDVPIAITVAGAAQLERQQITQVRDLDKISPAVSFVDGAPGGGAGIRGIATQSWTPSAEASVGIVVDGVPQGNVNSSNLFDMERVEVLRGPQGMLFGQSASAGIINMVTKAPKIGDYSGRMHIDYADNGTLGSKYGEQVVQGVINLPLTDKSALRAALFLNQVTGVEHDLTTGKDNLNKDFGFRARYLNHLTDKLTLNVIADYDKQVLRGNYVFAILKAVDPQTIASDAACGIVPSAKNNLSCSTFPTNAINQNFGLSAQADYSLGEYTLTSVTAYRGRIIGPSTHDVFSQKNLVPTLWKAGDNGNLTQVSQELRIESPAGNQLEWVAGAYAARSTYDQDGTLGVLIVLPPETINSNSIARTYTDTQALFGQLTWNFTDKVSGFAGLRLTHEMVYDRETFSTTIYEPDYFNPTAAFGPPDEVLSASRSLSNTSGRVGLQYRVNPDLMVYASVARGYKGPQVNDTIQGQTPFIVEPEIPTATEMGAKGMIGRVGVDLNLFYTKVENFQAQKCIYDPVQKCGPINVSQVISKGVELDLFGKPMRNLTINAGFIYNPVTYPDGFVGSDLTPLGGTQMTGAPVYKFTLSGEYVANLANNYQAVIGFDTIYKSLVHIYPSSNPDFDLKAHWISGARLSLRFPNRTTSVSLYVRNISNTPEPINIYPGPLDGDTHQVLYKQGLRAVGLSLDQSF
jgi:iron complex outermembrane receptor protein